MTLTATINEKSLHQTTTRSSYEKEVDDSSKFLGVPGFVYRIRSKINDHPWFGTSHYIGNMPVRWYRTDGVLAPITMMEGNQYGRSTWYAPKYLTQDGVCDLNIKHLSQVQSISLWHKLESHNYNDKMSQFLSPFSNNYAYEKILYKGHGHFTLPSAV